MERTNPFSAQLVFKAFKYTVYALLTLNIFLFYQEESLATAQTFSQGISLENIIQGFAATIDTAAWVLLLLLFELETSILDDRVLRNPRVQTVFLAVRTFSYGFILYACYGYISKILLTYSISPFVVADACSLVGQGFASIDTLDEYPPLDAQSCRGLAETGLYKLNGQQVLGSALDWQAIQWLAWVDVINSVTWIIVVAILEVDVWLQLRERFSGLVVVVSKYLKMGLYGILLACAVYWWFLGDILDFWDSFLWIVAFFFIELNLFQWQAETEAGAPVSAVS
ncbi:hypothetical protein N9399_03260 [Porticoccaceae bacterium]|jgi:hypothetical protein|nr:hypothetical protein [Porticoccaceae bacterium]